MINKIRRKFILIMSVFLAAVILCVCGTITTVGYVQDRREVNDTLEEIIIAYQTDFVFPHRNDYLNSIRSFVVELNSNQEILAGRYDKSSFTQNIIIEYTNKIVKKDNLTGSIDDVYYQVKTLENGYIIAGIDRSIENDLLLSNFRNLSLSCLAGYLVILLILWRISFWIVKPAKESLEKQRKFISDASHELKTPLSIINANTDVLENEVGNNKWISSIKEQSDRLNLLVADMLDLAKIEEQSSKVEKTNLDIAKIISNAVLSFDAVAFEKGKKIETNIDIHINVFANEQEIKKIFVILMDNALKYSKEKSTIKVTLTKTNKVTLEVYNDGCSIKDEEKKKIFERFYRVDDSRSSSSGGRGLGLAILKTIVEENNWKIKLDCQYGKYTKFIITF